MGKRKTAETNVTADGSSGTKKRNPQEKIITWNDDNTRSMLLWYCSHPLLWKKTEDDYKDRGKKRAALKAWLLLENILPECPVSESETYREQYNDKALKCIEEVENRFHAQRVRLNQELKNIPKWKSGQGVDDILETDSNWKFFKDIMFLRFDICTRKTQSNLNLEAIALSTKKPEGQNDDDNVIEEFRRFLDDSLPFKENDVRAAEKEHEAENQSQSQRPTQPSSSQPTFLPPSSQPEDKTTSKKPKVTDKKLSIEEQKVTLMQQCVEVLTKPENEDKEQKDPIDSFFVYFISAVKNLPAASQSQIVRDIHELLFNYS